MYKKTLLFFFLFIAVSQINAQEPSLTLNEILDRHKLSFGNQEQLNQMKTMRMKGIVALAGYELPIVISRQHPGLCHISIQRDKGTSTYFYDGNKAWDRQDDSTLVLKDPVEYATLMALSNFEMLLDHKDQNIQLALVGKENVEGKLAYNLIAKLKNETTENWFLDCATFRLVKVSGTTFWFNNRTAEKTILYDDYKPVQGLYLPHYIYSDITTFSSEVEIDSVEINPEIDSNMFINKRVD